MTLASVIKKALFAGFLFICCTQIAYTPVVGSIEQVIAAYDRQCLAAALWHEARGEPLIGQRAVLSIIDNRMTMTGHTACQTILQHGQFEFVHKVPWHVTDEMLVQLDRVMALPGRLPKDVLFFRTRYYHATSRSPW